MQAMNMAVNGTPALPDVYKRQDVLEKTKKGTRNSGLRPDRGHIGHQAAKLMKRAKVTEARVDAALEQKSRLLRNLDTAAELTLRPLVHPTSILVECKDLSIARCV